MGLVKGGFLRVVQTILYLFAFGCAAVVLGIYSYFLAAQSSRDHQIGTWEKAVEGISGAAVLYTIFAVVLTCCLAGVTFFSFLGLFMDILFAGAFIAVAIMTRDGAGSCSGFVNTPLGSGQSSNTATGANPDVVYNVTFYTACRLNTAAFAVSIIAIFFFIITAAMQIILNRSHKKDKRYGPSPDNGYTSGPAKKRSFWNRKSKKNTIDKDAELGATGTAVGGGLAAPTHHHTTRASHDTATTAVGSGVHNDKYETAPAQGTHGGYYTQPTGTGANPYGYENNATGLVHTGNTPVGPTYTTGTATNY